ncbi:MAG: response regulator [Thermoplasmata archaeon]
MSKDDASDLKKEYNILIVDDEEKVLKALQMTLKRTDAFNSQIRTASNGEEGLAKLAEGNFDLVLSDFRMPKMDGVEFLNKVRLEYPYIVRILITGYSEIDVAKNAITKSKVHSYVEKPWDRDELVSIICNELRTRDEKGEESNGTSKEPIDDKDYADNVEEALRMVRETQEEMLKGPTATLGKEMMVFEFGSTAELNEFSHKVRKMKSVNIEDVKLFENKYMVTLGILLESYNKIA